MGQIQHAGWVTVRVDDRGAVVWCDDWPELVRLAFRGHCHVKPGPHGGVVWAGERRPIVPATAS